MKNRTNTAFDVRGTPLVLGDFVRGIEWADTDTMTILRVTMEDLSKPPWYLPDSADNTASQACSMTAEQWRSLTAAGTWQTTTVVDKACMRVMCYIKIVPDEAETQLAINDPFFTVVHMTGTTANPDITKLSADSTMLLLPRNPSGQPYLVTSDLPATAAMETMRRFAHAKSTMILVRACMLRFTWLRT